MTFTNEQITTIQDFLTSMPYEACLLFVHADPFQLGKAALQLDEHYGWRQWPVGRELSGTLLDVAVDDRGPVAARWFRGCRRSPA